MTVPSTVEIRTTVNGYDYTGNVAPRLSAAEFVRDVLGLTGTKTSCEMEVCGVCSILVDGLPVSGCAALVADLDNKTVTTVEGLADQDGLSILQQAFIDKFAAQCGFCTSGFLIMATALLETNPSPTRGEVIHYLEGNICRCTGYLPIVGAVLLAAERTSNAGA